MRYATLILIALVSASWVASAQFAPQSNEDEWSELSIGANGTTRACAIQAQLQKSLTDQTNGILPSVQTKVNPGPITVIMGDGVSPDATLGAPCHNADYVYDVDTGDGIWSASKLTASMIVGRLVDEGVLDYDAPMKTYLDYWTSSPSDPRSGITIKHILSQTAGFGDHGCHQVRSYLPGTVADSFGLGKATLLQKLYGSNATIDYAQCAELIYSEAYGKIEKGVQYSIGNITFNPSDTFPNKGISQPLPADEVKPADYFWYTESNFQLIGALVEVTTGLTYGEAMDKYLRKPLGITDESFTPTAPHAGPGGWMFASADGYAKLLGKYVAGEFISKKTQAVMETKWTRVFNIKCFSGGNLPCCTPERLSADSPCADSNGGGNGGYALGMFFVNEADSDQAVYESGGSRGMFPVIDRRTDHWYIIGRQSPLQEGYKDLSTWGAQWTFFTDHKYLKSQLNDLYKTVHQVGDRTELSVESCPMPKCRTQQLRVRIVYPTEAPTDAPTEAPTDAPTEAP
jgi:CubicO group peptidase (beta-lactamase class C family)